MLNMFIKAFINNLKIVLIMLGMVLRVTCLITFSLFIVIWGFEYNSLMGVVVSIITVTLLLTLLLDLGDIKKTHKGGK